MAKILLGAALVTGVNRGIGLELIRQLVDSERSPRVLFAGCREPEGPRVRDLKNIAEKHPNVIVVKLDVTDSQSIAECVEQVEKVLEKGGLNLLINDAGIATCDTLETLTAEIMEQTFTTNIVAPIMMAKAFVPTLKRAAALSNFKGLSCSKAAVINVSSILGSLELNIDVKGPDDAYSYKTSKAAVNMFTQCLAKQLNPDGILYAALHPSWVQTDMGGNEAPLSVEDSICGLIQVMTSLSDKSEHFLDWKGDHLPW
uniref:C-factor-like n=1 Tax=Callorhinchus milii TaxID=7868 RepID=V9LB65_CALMI